MLSSLARNRGVARAWRRLGRRQLSRLDAIADDGVAADEPRYFIGADHGQSRNPTVIAVVGRIAIEPTDPMYARGLIKWQRLQEVAENLPTGSKQGQACRPTVNARFGLILRGEIAARNQRRFTTSGGVERQRRHDFRMPSRAALATVFDFLLPYIYVIGNSNTCCR
jgi:hypothetical protein